MRRRLQILGIVALLLVGAGCSLLPEFRVFQKKIDPAMAEKSPVQTEAERAAAKFVELRLARLIGGQSLPDYIRRELSDIHEVAATLSASLGEPKHPIVLEDKDAIIKALRAGLLAKQKTADQWKAFAKKYAGKTIEDTGIDLAPWGGGLGLVGLLAACILVPGFGTFVLFVIRRLRGTVQQVAQGVEEYAAAHPAEAARLKQYFSGAMDDAHKAIIAREQKFIDWAKVAKVAKTQTTATAVAGV